MRMIAARLRSTSSSVVLQFETLMRMAVCPCQTVGPTHSVPSRWMALMARRVVASSPKLTSV